MSDAVAPVAVVIVTRNSASWLPDCLSSLRELERVPAEVLIVDNASRDGSAESARALAPRATVLESGENAGFCRATNRGIAATTSPFILALNPDTRLSRRFLEELLPSFDDPRVGIACGKLLRFDGVTLDSAGQRLGRSRQPDDRGYGTRDDGRFDRDEEIFGACGAAALYRRAMLDEVAGPGGEVFDESFFAFYEDLDLAWRAHRFGWRAAYRYRALGWHARGGTSVRPGPPRFGALRSRSAEIRFHAVKNRYLTILRNDRLTDYLAHAPFVFSRDAATFVFLLATSPGVLARLWRERQLFRRALERRRLDASRLRHQVGAGARS